MRRIGVDVDDELYDRVTDAIPHGIRSTIFREIFSLLADSIEEHGSPFLGMLMKGEFSFAPKQRESDGD